MTPAEAIRRCTTVAECHALRASLGEMDSATYWAYVIDRNRGLFGDALPKHVEDDRWG